MNMPRVEASEVQTNQFAKYKKAFWVLDVKFKGGLELKNLFPFPFLPSFYLPNFSFMFTTVWDWIFNKLPTLAVATRTHTLKAFVWFQIPCHADP